MRYALLLLSTLALFFSTLAPASAKTVTMVIPGGGFYLHYPATAIADAFKQKGDRVVYAAYRLTGPADVYRDVRRIARRWKRKGYRVRAYGASAGGTLAARLAGEGEVDAAVAAAPPTNLVTWDINPSVWKTLGVGLRQRRSASPIHHITKRARPLLIVHATNDEVVPFQQSVTFVHRYERSTLRAPRSGGHLLAAIPIPGAIAWLRRH